jgi:hypothetical protein
MTRRWFWTTMLAGAFVPTLAWAQRDPDFYGPHMMWGGWLGGPGAHPHVPPAKTPFDILKERFARGEIDKEELEERRRLLAE